MAEKKGCLRGFIRIIIGVIAIGLIISAFSECGGTSKSESVDKKETISNQIETRSESASEQNDEIVDNYVDQSKKENPLIGIWSSEEMSGEFIVQEDGSISAFGQFTGQIIDDKSILLKENSSSSEHIFSYEIYNNILTLDTAGEQLTLNRGKYSEEGQIDENSVFDYEGNLIREDEIKDLEWVVRMNFGDEGALKAIVHTLGMKVYKIAKKDKTLKAVRVSLYYKDLIDKYGNDISWEDAHDSTFIVDGLDEVRKYKDGLAYALEYEVSLAYFVISGEYSYLWKN